VQAIQAVEGVTSIDLSALPDGMYYLHIQSDIDEKPTVHKFVLKK
jgi:hypothetical protein